jgi:hypothetical protein
MLHASFAKATEARGCWLLVAGCWLLVSWVLVLVAGSWVLGIHCQLLCPPNPVKREKVGLLPTANFSHSKL